MGLTLYPDKLSTTIDSPSGERAMFVRKVSAVFGLKVLFVTALLTGSVQAQVEPDRSGVGQAEFRSTELNIQNEYRLPKELPAQAASNAAADLAALGLTGNSGRVDKRGGRWATLMLSEPLLKRYASTRRRCAAWCGC